MFDSNANNTRYKSIRIRNRKSGAANNLWLRVSDHSFETVQLLSWWKIYLAKLLVLNIMQALMHLINLMQYKL